jgi:hypothetical protein
MTAVEWLHEKLAKSSQEELVGNINLWFKEAKEMEKQQIIDAYRRSTYQFEVDAKINCRTAEQYYNETFKNK